MVTEILLAVLVVLNCTLLVTVLIDEEPEDDRT